MGQSDGIWLATKPKRKMWNFGRWAAWTSGCLNQQAHFPAITRGPETEKYIARNHVLGFWFLLPGTFCTVPERHHGWVSRKGLH